MKKRNQLIDKSILGILDAVIFFKNAVEFFTLFMLSLFTLLHSLCFLNLAQFIMTILAMAK
jgi:hypothetical protein